MATTYDWSPLFDAINKSTNDWSQRSQYNAVLNGLIGKQVPGQVTPGTAGQAPQQTTIDATAQNIPGAPAPVQRSVSATIPGMDATAATQGAPTYDGMAGQALGSNMAAMLPIFRNLPPQVALPLLLNAGMKNADRKQSIEDARVTPLSDDEAKTVLGAAWKPDAKYGRDISGNVVTIQKGETLSQAAVNQQYGMKRMEGQIAAEAPLTQAQKQEHSDRMAGFSKPVSVGAGDTLVDPRTGKVIYNGMASSLSVPTDKNGMPVTGDAALANVPAQYRGQVKALGEYRTAPLTSMALRSPVGAQLSSWVNQAYPNYDASQYGAKVKARNDFTTGKNGNTVRSLNVAVQHLDQLGQLSTALGNGDIQGFNRIGQYFAQQTGRSAPTNFNAAKQLVGDEIVKAIVGAGGGVSDREEAAKNISAASSPQQLADVIKTYQGLMSGQLSGLRQQYEKSTGLHDFEEYLSPETRLKLETHSGGGSGGGGNVTKQFHYDAAGNRVPN